MLVLMSNAYWMVLELVSALLHECLRIGGILSCPRLQGWRQWFPSNSMILRGFSNGQMGFIYPFPTEPLEAWQLLVATRGISLIKNGAMQFF